ncbi:DeoR/GlpR family DNA-binding transcription regulator [Subtercola vilae]|uniref:DeoR/GlpR transcriptional regulator n=1 Tax=Subtercola vilae TaxID=2056433 RepID=A0A4T2BHQ6_9MICO|nr:DeoR/GlpR family DNA-binding transcription regulator [Subtercola vilae]TIH28616.1 DeoR/GlpR transcriptional regulator [Subtercola vilae]
MNAAERRRTIGHLLQEKPIGVDDMAATFAVSASTIRRDLEALSKAGDIVRTYGGARTVDSRERSLQERKLIAVAQKFAIGRLASSFVTAGSVVVLDAGTTVGALARNLTYREDITVVTNGLTSANILEHSTGIELLVVGGRLRHISSGFVGSFAEQFLTSITPDAVFLGADGVSARLGLCEATPEQASLKKIMIAGAHTIFVLADSTKLGAETEPWWTPLQQPWNLITDSQATAEQLEPFHALPHVTIHIAPAFDNEAAAALPMTVD